MSRCRNKTCCSIVFIIVELHTVGMVLASRAMRFHAQRVLLEFASSQSAQPSQRKLLEVYKCIHACLDATRRRQVGHATLLVLYCSEPYMNPRFISIAFCAILGLFTQDDYAVAQEYELVVRGGRVMDPQSGLDGIRDVAIEKGEIVAISEQPLLGREFIDANGLVVAPGFIDLHQHAWDEESIRLKALDGVTSMFELEVGTADVAKWYRQRDGVSRLNHGVSVGHIPVRMHVMGDAPDFLPPSNSRASTAAAAPEQIEAMAMMLSKGLDAGAVAVGFGVSYTPAATDAEILAMFRVAAGRNAPCHVHLRGRGRAGGSPSSALDTAQLAASVGARLCIVHLQAGAKGTMPELLRLMDNWQAAGQDVTAEVYPWTAGMTEIKSAVFADGFQQRLAITYNDFQWGATGERLTQESFLRYREKGGLVIVHNNTEAAVSMAIHHPTLMIASDGLKGHPRNAGTYARVLGHYVRETNGLDLMTALKKMSWLPARQLESRAVSMRRKGRVQVGCDADLTLFDPNTIGARATYENPSLPSQGIGWVLVNGTPVVRRGELVENSHPGRAIRAAQK